MNHGFGVVKSAFILWINIKFTNGSNLVIFPVDLSQTFE